MSTHRFPTPQPIHLHVEHAAGGIDVAADAEGETTVEITGPNEDLFSVEMSSDGRRLSIRPRRRHWLRSYRIGISVHLPAGSEVDVATASGALRVNGPVAALDITSASGSISVDQVTGRLEAKTASGTVRAGTVNGTLAFRSASGSLSVDRVGHRCEATTASGSITIGVADGDVEATSVSGRVAVREAHRGTVDVSATSGGVDVGVRRGTLAWLDVSSVSGRTSSALVAEGDAPKGGNPALTVRARSVSGSVSVVSAGPAPIAL